MATIKPGEYEQSLARSDLFKGLSQRSLERLSSIGKEEAYAREEVIFQEGDPGNKFYLVLEGAVRISRTVPGMGEEALAVMRPVVSFGEMSIIQDAPRSADARAHEESRLLVFSKDELDDLLFLDRDLAYEFLWKMVRMLSTRLRETTDKMTFLSVASKFE